MIVFDIISKVTQGAYMHKKAYKLNDIDKILTYVPPIVFLVIYFISMVALWGVEKHREKSQIEIYKQQQKIIQQEYINKYIVSVEKNVNKSIEKVENRLRATAEYLKGLTDGTTDILDREKLIQKIKELEDKRQIRVLLFDDRLNIWYGNSTIEYIIKTILKGKRSKKEILQYMLASSNKNTLKWQDTKNRRIQLSYFEYNKNRHLHIGVFSYTDKFRNLTTTAYINAIASAIYNPQGYYFWLYDADRKKVYNVANMMEWKDISYMPAGASLVPIGKYNLSIGITPTNGVLFSNDNKTIFDIKSKLRKRRDVLALLMTIALIVMLLFSFLFSKVIKSIFANYERIEKKKNRQISKLKERYELAVIASNDGLWDVNFKTNYTYFSQKWYDMLGYTPEEIKSYSDWIGLIHPDDKDRVLNKIQEHTLNKHNEHLISEYRLRKKDGEYIWVLGRGKVFVDDDGTPTRLSMMSMDINDKKMADEKMQELVAKEVAKNEQKRKMLIQQNKMAAMGEMIGAIAHQWRQPLNNISLILHFVRDNAKDPEFVKNKMDDFVERAKMQIEYMSHTIDDFRDFYRPSKAKATFCVNDAIKSTLAIVGTQIEKNKIDVSISGDKLMVHGHENEFKQAILNIISNAQDAILSQKSTKGNFQGKIDITIQKDSVKIYNNGGIATSEVLDRMFEPYFTTKFEDKGTGIGLYMTKMIIENSMSAEITARNYQEGVEFTIKGLK